MLPEDVGGLALPLSRKIELVWSSNARGSSQTGRTDVDFSGFADRDRLFEQLNGRAVTVADRCWRIEVYGISEAAGWRFLQLALTGPPERKLTLRIAAGYDATHVVRMIASWLAQPSEARHVLTVA
jgi:hypothetical protein